MKTIRLLAATVVLPWLLPVVAGEPASEPASAPLFETVQLEQAGDAVANADAASATPVPSKPKPQPPKPKTHKVKRGETLSSIVRKFDCDLGDLARANKLKAPKYAIKPGQSLTLQGCKG